MRRPLLLAVFIATIFVTFLLVAGDAHGSSTCQAYNPQTCSSLIGGSGTLPFTGLDVVLLVAGGFVLIVLGMVLHSIVSTSASTKIEAPYAVGYRHGSEDLEQGRKYHVLRVRWTDEHDEADYYDGYDDGYMSRRSQAS
jgi:hypothetical protein